MSRFNPDHELQPILNAAQHWLNVALLGQGSVFGTAQVWSQKNVASFRTHFIENPDEGEGTFMQKLKGQLEPAGPAVSQLAAEMTWVMLLCPSNISPGKKRESVNTIWSWSGGALSDDNALLSDPVLGGIGSAGTAFNTGRWREFYFLVDFVERFRSLQDTEQQTLLKDGWKFAEWMQELPDSNSRQLRHMLLYLMFPDNFERIFGGTDRRKIVRAFANKSAGAVASLSALEIDRELAQVRQDQAARLGRDDLDFYEPPLREVWQTKKEKEKAPLQEDESELAQLAAKLRREHVLEVLEQIDRDGYPQEARSTTYDLIHGTSRYPPKLVLSLASMSAIGEEFPRTHFSGGEKSSAFKILRNLGFSIERKDLVADLMTRFLRQADEASDLTVSSYPKRYRGLDVKVSFGQGNIANVPWISFTGFGQETSNGIYPVILYYRALGKLVVSYGISETNMPKTSWNLDEAGITIADAFAQQNWEEPYRYGASYVKAIFDLKEAVDTDKIQLALDQVIASYKTQLAPRSPEGSETDTSDEVEHVPYELEDALAELFLDEDELHRILALLKAKKNVILQGPPGVGKTFVCKRLAYLAMGEKAKERLEMVQFHQSYSYEDFIQGYRPSGQGFHLKNGIFYDFCQRASNDPANKYVFVIDEINRGNLSKVFGEAMMLIEQDKRGPDWAIPLTYSESTDERFYVPDNVYLIGLMNTADRSLAMVDYALRRRFGFFDLAPKFESDQFQEFIEAKGAEPVFIERLVQKMGYLNSQIASDIANLGPGYQIGHSYFCAIQDGVEPDWHWYCQIVEGEIGPLLREYYFDNSKQADILIAELLRQD